jgi:hypothetical protein
MTHRSPILPKLLLGIPLAATTATAARVSAADEASSPPVDVAMHDAPPLHRTLTLEWNPVALFLDRFSINLVIAPGNHHALVLSPFYTWARTSPYGTNLDASGNTLPYTLNVLAQTFQGFGGELGYRYYFELGGPRGFFVGPSLLLAAMTAKAGNGNETSFYDLGVAADVGYQAIVADRVTFSVGAGVQYAAPSKSIPDQEWPANVYANSGVQPRLLLSLGYAF